MISQSIQFINRSSRILGCDLFTKNYNPVNPTLLVVIFDIFTYFLINFADVYLFRDDSVRATFCVLTLGMVSRGPFVFSIEN